ncbi:uncharacterized protein LOC135813130 [Sycon ciliatum]|uniref:uncharacterized protein LOC135813125 n=1 Tax=Sycon ciliatum TaxID=27933 RepID=UPI0031F67055
MPPWQNIRQACRAGKLPTRKAKAEWVEGPCKEIECDLKFKNIKKAYETISKLTTKPTVKSHVIENKDGELLTESKKVADRWAQYCSDLYTYNINPAMEVLDDLKLGMPLNDDDRDLSIIKEDVAALVDNLKAGKSTGDCMIPGELLKESGVIDILTTI